MSQNKDIDDAVVSGQAWEAFCDRLKQAGQQILRAEAPDTPLDRAEGYRYLTRLLRIGLEMHLEFADPDFPGFFAPSHETGKIGADNPDNLYLMGRLNGCNEYIIRGQRGTVPYLSFGTQKGGYETNGKMEQTGFLDARDLELDADGNFEVVLSQTPRPRNWVRLEPESNAVIVRQTFLDRKAERPAQMSIARLGSDAAPQPLSTERLMTGLTRTADFVEGTARLFANWAQSYLPHSNALPPSDQALCQSVGGDPNIVYYHSHWRLAPDEALVIHVPRVPECRFWNLQINNYWMESLDYRYHRICLNQHSARLDTDGGVTMVLAHTDPGHPNWLQTAGHDSGTMCLRWVGADVQVDPLTQIIKLNDLEQTLSTKALAA
ncbi:DUF1214 domain-containing protein [Sinimarinibacterium sp. CAU 1509]|uniref:DUF1214 domain-containing protein n=1 Tax=Sinimarinibacterium sp. CAU 1509 TaxID=2562283 RepID=UPI0010ACDC5D|nr:DUF1214 domain-containing protein [Sinimarinibacterium sp. CAU 1509]TJY64913.1 DUF1214 domain-containing protein [Sinimarinibacterium sp. CAU 1509]